nr:hypothetical protein [uncultured Agathobaculum sp.]
MTKMSAEMEKKKTAEVVWLDYFNEYLFEHGIIDEVTRNKLKIKIITTTKKR